MMTRAVVVQLSFYYGASLADILNVVALSCVGSLGAHVDIPTQCAHDGLDLMVRTRRHLRAAPHSFALRSADRWRQPRCTTARALLSSVAPRAFEYSCQCVPPLPRLLQWRWQQRLESRSSHTAHLS